ncbi:MAG: DUF3696 domain-containing protein [Bryobacterales bacterium]|nr:DUF3696 domain-containing protein [Bryobacterales bacterium]
MLTRIDLSYFKCFETLKLPLSPLTLLSGANASGKSSVMQALVLLHQTMCEHEWSLRLMLNGAVTRLGTVADVIDQVYGRRECGIELWDDDHRYGWTFTGGREAMAMDVSSVAVDGVIGRNPDVLQNLLPEPHGQGLLPQRLRKLTYLTAERLGPREHYILDDPQLTPVVGSQGEYAVSVLYSGRGQRVLDKLVLKDVPPTRFRQVEARMAQLFPGCVLVVEQVPRANAVTLGIRTSKDTDAHRPIHTGFGLTQALPVIVAALSASENDLLLIENPEVHLHPAGQAMMGHFMAEVASAGVQVVIETHSDHVMNGIRRAVKEGLLASDDAALHFFRSRTTDAGPQVESPTINPEGDIDAWPKGFFDQFDKDMNYFAGWS